MIRTIILTLSLALASQLLHAETVLGKWKTIDDETGQAKSIVLLFEENGKLYGKIEDLLIKPDDTLCEKCKGPLHNQPMVGMRILNDMTLDKDGKAYSGGEILDPAKGKTYRCKLWLEDGKLQVRGYLGFFFRTQTWHRVE